MFFYGATIDKKLFASQIKHSIRYHYNPSKNSLQTPCSRSQHTQVKSLLEPILLVMKIAKRQCNLDLYHNTHPPKSICMGIIQKSIAR